MTPDSSTPPRPDSPPLALPQRRTRLRFTVKQVAILLGFFTSLTGTLGSFLLLDALNKEMNQLSTQQASAKREIEQLQRAASEYFLCSQQGDLVYSLSLQTTTRQDLVALLYQGNLLDRATPVRNIIGSLAISQVLDYRTTYDQYEALNRAAREQLSFDRFVKLKEFEHDMVEQSTKRIAELYNQLGVLGQKIDLASRRLASRQHLALILSVLGTTMLLFANLLIERGQGAR